MNTFNLASCTTHGIRVDVRPEYIEKESNVRSSYFVFEYRVEITNESPIEVQLLEREWDIVDALGRLRHVAGEGVVGKKPTLSPGARHQYRSGCHFHTPIGMMRGRYLMLNIATQQSFWVDIPEFTLEIPCISN